MSGFPDFLPDRLRYQRWLRTRDLPKREKGHCRWCGQPVQKPRRSWCSDACVEQYTLRSNSTTASQKVFERDRGVCAVCGIDTHELAGLDRRIRASLREHRRALMLMQETERLDLWAEISQMDEWLDWRDIRAEWGPWNISQSLWEADHIIPVVEGGGCCGLENYRTLCQLCHKRETAELAARRAVTRALESGRGMQTVMEYAK